MRRAEPRIGVLMQPSTVLAAEWATVSLVTWLTKAGAVAVPFSYMTDPMTLRHIMTSLNAVVFPGGPQVLDISSPFMKTSVAVYELAREMSMPILGICQGLEVVVTIVASQSWRSLRSSVDARRFTGHIKIGSKVIAVAANHGWAVGLDTFARNKPLSAAFRVVAATQDRKSKTYVAALQSTSRWPVLLVQFHPERPGIDASAYVPQDAGAIALSTEIATDFLEYARKYRPKSSRPVHDGFRTHLRASADSTLLLHPIAPQVSSDLYDRSLRLLLDTSPGPTPQYSERTVQLLAGLYARYVSTYDAVGASVVTRVEMDSAAGDHIAVVGSGVLQPAAKKQLSLLRARVLYRSKFRGRTVTARVACSSLRGADSPVIDASLHHALVLLCEFGGSIRTANIEYYPLTTKKLLPPAGTQISTHHINSGYTSQPSTGWMLCWRMEERDRVISHEMIHFLDMDIPGRRDVDDVVLGQERLIRDLLPISADTKVSANEALAETLAGILNAFHVTKALHGTRTIVETLQKETEFAVFQAAKILEHYGASLELLGGRCVSTPTSAVGYYIIRAALLWDMDAFLVIAGPSLRFGDNGLSVASNVRAYVQTVVTAIQSPSFREALRRAQSFVRSCSSGSDLRQTLRMVARTVM